MKIRSLLLIGLLLVTGCSRPTTHVSTSKLAALAPDCQSAGTVQAADLDLGSGLRYHYNLYLPPCYDGGAGGTVYPILYLVPGRSSAPETWFAAGLAPVADELILSRELPPFIIVTTENTEFDMPADNITKVLMPYIESTYPISPERRYHAVGGGSLGCVASYRIGFRAPERFASVGMFGCGVISGEEPQVRTWLAAMTPGNTPRVFLNTGFQDPLMMERARAMMGILDEYGISHTHVFTDGPHAYSYWITNMPAYLHWVALDWK